MISSKANHINDFDARHIVDSFRVLLQHKGPLTSHVSSPSIPPLIICALRYTIALGLVCIHYAPESGGKSVKVWSMFSNLRAISS
jgi:hypothetical protein